MSKAIKYTLEYVSDLIAHLISALAYYRIYMYAVVMEVSAITCI